MVTDIHCHFIPDELFKFVQACKEFDTCVTAMDGERVDITVRGMHFGLNPTFFEPARQVARMDLLGIDRTVISLATPLVNYYLEPKIACEAARLCNDGFAELVASEPGRFLAWAFLPMQDPTAAAAELRRCVRDHGFIGGHVATNVRGTYLPDEAFRPIFDTAKELDVPLFLHPVDPPGRDRTGDNELTVVAGYPHDLHQFPRPVSGPEIGLRPYRRVQPAAAQPDATRGRYQRDTVACAAAQSRGLPA
jgi:aminocarboxymuconate-semialdehyde decarboxylase